MASKKKRDEEPPPLDRLVRSLAVAETLLAAGKAAPREAVAAWVCDLAWAVGTDPVDLRAAAKVCGRKGIRYMDYEYDSYTEVLYRDARLYYDTLYDLMHGYIEDEPSGELSHYGRDEDIADQWGKLLPKLRKAVPTPFPPGEMARVAELARKELEQGKTLPPPPGPAVYDRSRAKADGLTKKSALAHAAKLADYRAGDKDVGEEGADVFTFYAGEPEDRFVTKIGGLPYRPASLPWPTREDGTPLSFFAQICFADSRDLVSAADDVLLVFATEPHSYSAGPRAPEPGLRFEWYPFGLTKLVAADAIPDTPWKLLPCYATCERVSEADGPAEGAKIGGTPFVIQNEYPTDGEFLAALGQLRVSATRAQEKAGFEALRMDDAGLLNLYDDCGDLDWNVQSY